MGRERALVSDEDGRISTGTTPVVVLRYLGGYPSTKEVSIAQLFGRHQTKFSVLSRHLFAYRRVSLVPAIY